MKEIVNFIKSLPVPGRVVGTIIIVLSAILMIWLSGCTATHMVSQSSYNTETGDSIVIRYEQSGRGGLLR